MKKIDAGVEVTFPGLIVPRKYPYFGCSPDGIVRSSLFGNRLVGLEIKCPQKMYKKIPKEYICQIQGTMGLLGLEYYYFVIWTPKETKIELIEYDEAFFNKQMLPSMIDFYFNMFIPTNIQNEKNQIETMPIEVDPGTLSFRLI